VERILIIVAYLLGSIPSAYLVVRLATGEDVRKAGSGNVGTTNAVRSAGWWAGLMVAFLDVGKGVLPVVLMHAQNPASRWVGAAAAATVVGHCFPVWLRFSGGKGAATAVGAFAVIAPRSAALAVVVWLVVLAVTRVVSLSSLVAAAAFPVLLAFVDHAHPHLVMAAVFVSVLIIWRHRENIRRLAAGTEPRVGRRKDGNDEGGDL